MCTCTRRWLAALTVALFCAVTSGCLPDRLDDAALDQQIATATYAASCADQVDCALAPTCAGDASCRAACALGAKAQASGRATATTQCRDACIERDCATFTGAKRNECDQRCLVYACADDVLECAAGEPTGTAICPSIFACFQSCLAPSQGGSVNCVRQCGNDLAAGDYSLAEGVAVCLAVATNNHKSFSSTCSAELAACYAGGVSGSGSCHEIFGCSELCAKQGTASATCTRQCMADVSVGAQIQYVLYTQCGIENPGKQIACDAELIACGDPSGSTGCKEGSDELAKCIGKSGTESLSSCIALALHKSKPAAAKPLLDSVRCLAENCAEACAKPTGCTLCLTTKCKAQTDACSKS